jgi:phosphoribosyl-AMP cyclohydrolase
VATSSESSNPSSVTASGRATFSHLAKLRFAQGRRKKASRFFESTAVSHDHDLEEKLELRPKFDAAGLVTCVATDAATGDVLMVAHMNAEALRKTIASGEAWYYSRSRGALWRKGESSGQTQRVVEMRLDCDQDAVWLRVEQVGAACHTGRRSCFYRAVNSDQDGPKLSFVDADKVFDPKSVYNKHS